MGEAKRKAQMRRSLPSRVCPVDRIRCSNPRCQGGACEMTQGKKSEPYMIEGRLGQPPLLNACRECPLRRSSLKGYLGGYTPENYIRILHSDASIACHMSPGFHEGDHAQQRHCTGVCAYRANVCKVPRAPDAGAAVKLIGMDKENYFASPQEFVEHHRSKP